MAALPFGYVREQAIAVSLARQERPSSAPGPDYKGSEEDQMNWEQVEGKWKQYAGQLKEKWGKLTDDDLQQIAGKREQLVGKIQERYGIAKEEAERQIDDFSSSLNANARAAERSSKTHAGR